MSNFTPKPSETQLNSILTMLNERLAEDGFNVHLAGDRYLVLYRLTPDESYDLLGDYPTIEKAYYAALDSQFEYTLGEMGFFGGVE